MHSLRFIVDADMPRSSAEVIRSTGYDVEDVRDIGMRSAKDGEIIEYPPFGDALTHHQKVSRWHDVFHSQ